MKSAVVFAALVATLSGFAQKSDEFYVPVSNGDLNIRRISFVEPRVQGAPDPYLFAQTRFLRHGEDGTVGFLFYNPADINSNEYGDDAILSGGQRGPGAADGRIVACASQLEILVYATATMANAQIQLRLRGPWDTTATPDPFVLSPVLWESAVLDVGAVTTGDVILLTVPVDDGFGNPLPVPKGVVMSTVVMNGLGFVVHQNGGGNVLFEPGRATFRRRTPAAGLTFTSSPLGNFSWALRGTHNHVISVDFSALPADSHPVDLWQGDTYRPPTAGVRKNMMTVEYDTGGTTGFSAPVLVDENGNMTLAVASSVVEIRLRRYDTSIGLVVPVSATATPCAPFRISVRPVLGDVNGDGIIDDIDLAIVLTNFGASQ